jgi:hypothetical protein
MMNAPLEHVITLALDLTPSEQAKLIEQVASHLANQFSQDISLHQPQKHWGKKVIAFLETLDGDEWEDIDDPVEWVKAQRRESERELDWGDDE